MLALCVDWLLSMLAAGVFVGTDVWTGTSAGAWAPLAVFAAEVWLLTALLGASAGQRILNITVVRLAGGPVGLWSALIRTLLICLVLPPVIYDRDQRGLHDMAVGSIVVRR